MWKIIAASCQAGLWVWCRRRHWCWRKRHGMHTHNALQVCDTVAFLYPGHLSWVVIHLLDFVFRLQRIPTFLQKTQLKLFSYWLWQLGDTDDSMGHHNGMTLNAPLSGSLKGKALDNPLSFNWINCQVHLPVHLQIDIHCSSLLLNW